VIAGKDSVRAQGGVWNDLSSYDQQTAIYAAARRISPEIASRFSNGQSFKQSYMAGDHGCYQALLAKMRYFFPTNRVGSYRMWAGDDSENEGVKKKKRKVGKTSAYCSVYRSVVTGVAATKPSGRENETEGEFGKT